ncbi:MAG: hypothetical protein CMJ83_06280 [Planctomycetes bacterium]|nr:hypothetical protein [Planctomycetota bacterium]
MGRGGRGRGKRAQQKGDAVEREALERAWQERIEEAPELAALVVARGAQREPFHRWLGYRQGFAPELVRRFLAEGKLPDGPVLDPFCGSGTVPTECARQGRFGIGGDVVSPLLFCAAARGSDPTDWTPPEEATTFEACWAAAVDADDDATARAAVLQAVSAAHDGEGRKLRDAATPRELVLTALTMMREDAMNEGERPESAAYVRSDARRLPYASASIAGVVTSPPYLSRYDYARVNDPLEKLYSGTGRRRGRRHQVRASRTAAPRQNDTIHPAVDEAAVRLANAGQPKLAAAVTGYAHDLDRALAELARVLRPGGPLWLVVAGADLKRVYIPADLVLAERCAEHGLRVERVEQARLLRGSSRLLGGLGGVAPREVIIRCRRRLSPIAHDPHSGVRR